MKPILLIVWMLVFTSFSYSQTSDIQKLRENLLHDALVNQGYKPRIERYITSDYSKAGFYLESLNEEGGWDNIEYTDTDNKWDPLHHLDRVLVMSFNYMKDTSQMYQSKELLAGIEKSINYWYTINPECRNWYKNRIAKQFYFNVIALLLEDIIDENLHAKMVIDLTENPTMTGSNRTLLATSTFYKGVLENDSEKIKLGVSGVTDQIVVTTDEGVQPDYSFHQHGKFIYNGSYGFNYLRESAWLATIVHGTRFAFSDEHIKVLRDYYLEGTRWMIRGGTIDYNVRGRQVGRHDALKGYANFLIPTLEHLAIADPKYQKKYEESIHRIAYLKPQDVLGHKHFWRSDYTIHHHKNYTTSLKMCSERTVGIELNMNTENKLGYWLPYGLTYTYKRGDEYNSIFPVWDWARLPGVTNPYVEIEETLKGKAHTQQTSFVGGVSNGKFGVSAMDFDKNETKAKKAWFWFENEWVALGAGIESSHKEEIVSGINQCLLKGIVSIDGKAFSEKQKSLKNPNWIEHEGIGYIFPENTNIELKADTQKGNLQRIYGLGKDTVYSSDVFSLWINHGKNPKNASYQYIVVPGLENLSIEEYTQNNPIEILINTKEIQAVKHKQLNVIGIVFHQPGRVKLSEELEVEAENPSLLLVDLKNKEISVSEPTGELDAVTFHFKKNGNIWTNVYSLLESHKSDNGGKSLISSLNLD